MTKTRKPSPADVVRLGLQTAQLKAGMDPRKWAAAVRAAHARGLTVSSALDPSIPDALKARTQQSLAAQAQKMIGTAYAPQQKELDTQLTQTEGLRQKRLSDEASFNAWYADQMKQINDNASAAQQLYLSTAQGEQQKTMADVAKRQADLAAQTQQGTGQDLSNSVYLKGAQEREATRNDIASGRVTQAADAGQVVARDSGARTLGVIGQHAAAIAGIENDATKARTDIFGKRLALDSERAAKYVEQFASLLGKEQDKANAVMNFQGLQAQLSDKAAARELQNEQFYAGLKEKGREADAANATSAANNKRTTSAMVTVANIRATQAALDRDLRKASASRDRAIRLKIARDRNAGTAGAPSDAAIKYSSAQVQVIHTIRAIIQKYHSKFRDAAHNVIDTRQALISRGYTDPQIQAGLMLARHGHITDALANQLGILPQHRG